MYLRKSLFLLLALSGIAMFSGCSGSFGPSINPAASEEVPIGGITGAVHGGQAPVTGAQIYLFAAATNGFGKASTSLITSGKTGVSCNSSGSLNGDCYAGNAIFTPTLTITPAVERNDEGSAHDLVGTIGSRRPYKTVVDKGHRPVGDGNAWIGDRVKGVVQVNPQASNNKTFAGNVGTMP